MADEKNKRVNRIKKIIIGLLLVLLTFPTVLSIVLMIRLQKTNRLLQDMQTQVESIRLQLEVDKSLDKANSIHDIIFDTDLQEQSLPEENDSWEVAGTKDEQPSAKHQVCLTFDDGPSIYTGVILDILETYGVKASFFVVGKEDEESQANMKRIVEGGHTLGMHSYSHRYSEIYASREAFEEDYWKIRDLISSATGTTPVFYRFPGGSSNKVSSVPMKEFEDFLSEQEVTFFDWNISAGDATGDVLSVDRIVENAIRGIENNNTSVVLLHDSADKYSTVRALPRIIEAILKMEDTELVPITKGTNLVQHLK